MWNICRQILEYLLNFCLQRHSIAKWILNQDIGDIRIWNAANFGAQGSKKRMRGGLRWVVTIENFCVSRFHLIQSNWINLYDEFHVDLFEVEWRSWSTPRGNKTPVGRAEFECGVALKYKTHQKNVYVEWETRGNNVQIGHWADV